MPIQKSYKKREVSNLTLTINFLLLCFLLDYYSSDSIFLNKNLKFKFDFHNLINRFTAKIEFAFN